MAAPKESLATAFQRCKQSFEAVLNLLTDYGDSSRAVWEDEASRLRLWGSNIGAAQSKASTSLDFRLRDADTVRLQIHKNLSNLDEALQEALECLGELAQLPASNRDSKHLEECVPSQVSSTTLLQQERASSQCQEHHDTSSSDDEASAEDLQAAFDDVVSLINSLFRMTLYIRNPSRRDQLKHRDTSAVANFETFDVSHIMNKFPKAAGSLTQRLGQANTVRRANVRYWERHHKKLAFDETVNDAATIAPLSESVATAFQPVQVEEEQKDTRSHFSGTSYMESLLGGESVRRPDLPEVGRGGAPFQCPICCYIVTVSGQREWMKHVFFDLQPYVCVFENCTTPLLLYENRRDWFAHVTKNHLSRNTSNAGLQQLQCPLCQVSVRSLPLIRRHLARHLEEVALFSLPNSLFGEDTEMVDDDEPADYSSDEEVTELTLLPVTDPGQTGTVDVSQYSLADYADPELAKALPVSTQHKLDGLDRAPPEFLDPGNQEGEQSDSSDIDAQKKAVLDTTRAESPTPVEQMRKLESDWARFVPLIEAFCSQPPFPIETRNARYRTLKHRIGIFVETASGPSTLSEGTVIRSRSAALIRVAEQLLQRLDKVPRFYAAGEELAHYSSLGESASPGLDRPQIQEQPERSRTSPHDRQEMHRGQADAEHNQGDISSSDDELEDEAGDDEEEEDWEAYPPDDDVTETSKPLHFKRVDSRPKLRSRPSMLSMALERRRAQQTLVDKAAPIDDESSSTPDVESPRDTSDRGGKPSTLPPSTTQGRSSLVQTEDGRGVASNLHDILTSDVPKRAERQKYTSDDSDPRPTKNRVKAAKAYIDSAIEARRPLAGLAESTSNVDDGTPYPRRGKTRLPKRLVHTQVLHDLGYEFEEEDSKTLRVHKALREENIDEVFEMSKEYFLREGKAVPVTLSDYITELAGKPEQSKAESPKDRRRRMLSTELDESLRKNLLWERQAKQESRAGAQTEEDRLRTQNRSQSQEARIQDLDFAEKAESEERHRSVERHHVHERETGEEEEFELRKKEQWIREATVTDEKCVEDSKKLGQKLLDEEEEAKERKRKESELEERLFTERVYEKFRAAGYSDAHIEEVLQRKKKEHSSSDREWAIDLSRPTYIKVDRKYLDPVTLDAFRLPWEWDRENDQYIIIKKYIDHEYQDELFEHTRRLKERRLISGAATVTLRPADSPEKNKDHMHLVVRKGSPSPGQRRFRSSGWRGRRDDDDTVRSDDHVPDDYPTDAISREKPRTRDDSLRDPYEPVKDESRRSRSRRRYSDGGKNASAASPASQLPPPPPQWTGHEDSIRNWLKTQADTDSRKQKEEMTIHDVPATGASVAELDAQRTGAYEEYARAAADEADRKRLPNPTKEVQLPNPPLQTPQHASAAQQRPMVMPERMRWIYRDPQGHVQGPWSGLEMHDWYKAGFFAADLPIKKVEDTDFEPLAQLVRRVGNSREPFLVPQIGVPHGPASVNPTQRRPTATPAPTPTS